jgi:integrase
MPRIRREIPWIEQHANGTFYIHWYDESTKRTKRESTHSTDAMEAQQVFAKWLAKPELRETSRLAGHLTCSQVLDDYFREHVAEKVIAKYRQEYAIRHLKQFFGATPLKDVDIPMSRSYRDVRQAGVIGGRNHPKGSSSTIRRELIVLQAAANHALRWKRVAPADMPSIELPPNNVREGEAPYLTIHELQRAIVAAPPRLQRFIRICYYTAARRNSIETMLKSQVDLKAGRINLQVANATTLQKNSKKRRPIIALPPEIRSDLETLLIESPNHWLWGDDNKMYQEFHDHMVGLGLTDKAYPHILRHSRATHLLQQGVSLWDVAKLLGDTVVTTEKVYGHCCPDHMAAALSMPGSMHT